MQVNFQGYQCILHLAQYNNGRTALLLHDAYDSMPVATATINVPDEPIAEDELVIKNYSQNEGMLETLVDAGILHKPHRIIYTGFIAAPVCRLAVSKETLSQTNTDALQAVQEP